MAVSLLLMVKEAWKHHKGQKYRSYKWKCLKLECDLWKRTA